MVQDQQTEFDTSVTDTPAGISEMFLYNRSWMEAEVQVRQSEYVPISELPEVGEVLYFWDEEHIVTGVDESDLNGLPIELEGRGWLSAERFPFSVDGKHKVYFAEVEDRPNLLIYEWEV